MPTMTILQLNYDAADILLVCSSLFAGMACSYRWILTTKLRWLAVEFCCW